MENPNSHFAALRAQARDRRDKEISHARAEYEVSLSQISELEQRLLGKIDQRRLATSAAIERVIPRDEPFTVPDIMAALESFDPSRVWPMATVRRHVTALRNKGLVRRVKRHKVNEPATYVRSEGASEREVEEKDLRQLILETVTSPMRTAEVCAALLEAGYKTKMIPGHFRTTVIRRLKTAGFKEWGGKWGRDDGRSH
jgi:hypothetical protein